MKTEQLNREDGLLVSVITPVKNGMAHLEEAINSVLHQSYKHIEYIIIDGDSDDATVDIIRKYERQISRWISEPDSGIYHAMNKGISMATGEIIAILNSDDRLEPTAIEEVTAAHRLTPSDIYYGQLIRFRQAGGKLLQKTLRPDLGKMYKTMSIFHPATCITKATYERLGFYNEQYRIAADYDFLLRALRAGYSFRYIDKPLCRFLATGGISAMSCRSYAEAVKIHRAHKTGYAGYMRWMHIKCMCKILAKTIIFTLLNALGLRPALDRQIARRWEKQVKL